MTRTEIRQIAYNWARKYMADQNRPTRWAMMTAQDRNLFQYTRKVNEQMLSKVK